ncbi:Major facilitator superfamily domain-containing protein 6 [Amphibalanus amphitrite]|uniref:Major facilitator superfamily domain-containing protein 6 n=1 Tax=Amphibalanus amphitrite TaxID=1232801 RepID=A0A6A4XBZ6_AMPAM|nr:Major facilitator superfamily domain-containing protein 6 [Amphibalanus amphitrite]
MGTTAEGNGVAEANGNSGQPPAPPRKWYHINKQFMPIKLIYFCCHAAGISILPLLTLHMTSIGLTFADVAQVYLFMPVASFLGPPVIGFLADRTGRIRDLYIGCLVMHCVFHHALLFVPPSPHTTPEALAASANGTTLSCTDWPPPSCANLTRSLHCHLECPPDSEGELIACPAGDSCLSVGAAAELVLQLGADGCQLPALLTDNVTELELAHAELSCPDGCRLECAPGDELPISDRTTYWTYFFLRLAATFFLAPAFTLLDATCLAVVKEFRSPGQNFGRQRVGGIIASVIMPPLVGAIIDAVSTPGAADYSPAFYAMEICMVLTIVTIFVFHLHVSLPEKAHIGQLFKVLRRPEALVFILVVAILGSMWGFLESFLFVFLKKLKAPTYMLGLTMTVAGLASIPANWWSDAICSRIGHINILIISFFGYLVRYVGYSYIRNPWLAFPFELLEVATTHLMWNSAATYAGQLAPPGLLATLTGFAGALHYSFGRGIGSFLGGYLMALFGPVIAMRSMGVASGVCGVLYALAFYGCLRGHMTRRELRQRQKALARQQSEKFGEGPHEMAAMLEEVGMAAK